MLSSEKSSKAIENPVKKDVEGFNKNNLKKTDTKECPFVPTQEQIDEEKKAESNGKK